jgi:hypothetical protein
MLTRGQKLTVAIILAINAAIPIGAFVVFAGPFRFAGLVVVAIEIAVLLVIHRRYGRDPLRWLTPIPPREGTSRSGQPMVEAFYRARDDVRERYLK